MTEILGRFRVLAGALIYLLLAAPLGSTETFCSGWFALGNILPIVRVTYGGRHV